MRHALACVLLFAAGALAQGLAAQDLLFDMNTDLRAPATSASGAETQGSISLKCNPCILAGNMSIAAGGPSFGHTSTAPKSWSADNSTKLPDFDFSKDWVGAGFFNLSISYNIEVACTPGNDGRCLSTFALAAPQEMELPWAPGLRVTPGIEYSVLVSSSAPVTFNFGLNAQPPFGTLTIPLDTNTSRATQLSGLSGEGLGLVLPRILSAFTADVTATMALRPTLRWTYSRPNTTAEPTSGGQGAEIPRLAFKATKSRDAGQVCMNVDAAGAIRVTVSHQADRIDLSSGSSGTPLDVAWNTTVGTHCQLPDDSAQSVGGGGQNAAVALTSGVALGLTLVLSLFLSFVL